MTDILTDKRENSISGTNYEFVALSEKRRQHESDEIQGIRQDYQRKGIDTLSNMEISTTINQTRAKIKDINS
ncbi:hypothetical protein RhiirB3_441598 [Rhizophagus irregularis]|nr:hypothetical protein RhiirB3_441598 [Rhizophagus irregularis]